MTALKIQNKGSNNTNSLWRRNIVMKNYCLSVLVSLLFSGCFLCQVNQAAAGIFPYEFQQKVFDNGFKVILIPMDSPGIVAYYSIVRTGSRDEYEPGHSGFAHFFEHMMFRGTKNYPGHVYDRLITEIGANANAYTSNDITCYHLKFASEDLEKVMELESDRFQNLFYSEQAFKTEAGAVHGEYLKSLSSPWMVLNEKLYDTAFDVHTYKHTTIGFREDIEAMPTMYEYSKSFFNRYYRPENVILLIVGDINPAASFELAQKYYGDWQPGYVPPKIPAEPEQKRERKAEVTFSGKTLPILSINYKAMVFDPTDIEMAACYLLGDIVFGETSEIYKKLVIDEQRVRFIGANFSASRDPGLFSIYTMVNTEDDIENIKNEIYRAIEFYQDNLVDEKRLNDLKSNLKYSFLMRLNTAEAVAGRLARLIAMTGNIESVDQLYQSYDKVTTEDIITAANKYLVKQKRTVIVLKGEI
ncbi:MAG TPA: insulinase family protein [bacterium]|nr:insulinase family protein [bacterium]